MIRHSRQQKASTVWKTVVTELLNWNNAMLKTSLSTGIWHHRIDRILFFMWPLSGVTCLKYEFHLLSIRPWL